MQGITLQEQQHRRVIAFGELLIKETEPKDLLFADKTGFFGMEAHLTMPIEVSAIALASRLFSSYKILLLDSFQAMRGPYGEDIALGAVEKTKRELAMLAETLNLNFDIVVCSDFFKKPQYNELLKDLSAAVKKSPQLTELVKATIPAKKDKNDLSYSINEIATTSYMQMFNGINVKIGQQREKLYDAVIALLVKGIEFGYLFPFYALGIGKLKEVTPYNPESGTENGGKRIRLGDLNDAGFYAMRGRTTLQGITEYLRMGTPKAQKSLYRLAMTAGIARGELHCNDTKTAVEAFEGEQQSQPKIVATAIFRHILMPYEVNKATRDFKGLI